MTIIECILVGVYFLGFFICLGATSALTKSDYGPDPLSCTLCVVWPIVIVGAIPYYIGATIGVKIYNAYLRNIGG